MMRRTSISPIIATVLIIAVTLIAAVAIGGFVFGLFGSSANTGQVGATSASITAGTVTAAAVSVVFTCTTPAGSQALIFTNLGSATVSVLSLSITFGGNTYSGVAPNPCSITAGSTMGLAFTTLAIGVGATLPAAGSQFSGFIVTSNGAQVVFTGAFQ